MGQEHTRLVYELQRGKCRPMEIINSDMNDHQDIPVAERWRALRERADISMEKLAKKLGYKAASGIQRYENPEDFKKPFLPMDFVRRLIPILEPLKISRDELYRLAGVPEELMDGSRGLKEGTLITVLIAAHEVMAHQDIQMPPERLGKACFDVYKQAVKKGADAATIKEITESAIVAIVRDLDAARLSSERDA